MPSRKVTMKKPVAPARGEMIRFVKGSYAGEKGWINMAKPSSDLMVHVILDAGQAPKHDDEFITRVKKNSIVPDNDTPSHAISAEAYVVLEDRKVAYHLAMLSEAIAEAGIEEVTDELTQLLAVNVQLACTLQAEKGKKAKFSQTAFVVKEKLKSKPKRSTKKRAPTNEQAMKE